MYTTILGQSIRSIDIYDNCFNFVPALETRIRVLSILYSLAVQADGLDRLKFQLTVVQRESPLSVWERGHYLSLSLAILAFNSSKLSWLRNCRWCEWMGRAACVWWRERERKWFLSKSEWKLRERRESCNFNTPLWRQILKNIFIWTFKMTLLVIIVMLWWNFDLKLINYERVAFSILRTSKTLL